jgi:hypothetical protein
MSDSDHAIDPRDLTDPWVMLNAMRQVELSERAQYQQHWLDLVSKRPDLQRDALLEAGKEIWRYRIATARTHVDNMEDQSGTPSVTAGTVAVGDKLAEMAYRPTENPAVGYLVHDSTKPDDPPVWMDKLEHGRVTYVPPSSQLVEKGIVLLPTGIEEYGSDWKLFLQVRDFILRYLQLDSVAFCTLICAYALMTWVYDRFDALPYLRAIGDFGSGKTRFLQVLGSICFRPMFVGGAATPSPVFRIIERFRGTLVIDEADFGKSDHWDDIGKIFNQGYAKGFAVLRSERGVGDNFDVAAYDCYGPKLLATRRRFNDPALESRCLSHTMPLLPDLRPDMPLVLGDTFRSDAQRLRNMLLLWRFRRRNTIAVDPNERIPDVEPRVSQIFQPLLACAADRKLKPTLLGTIQAYSESLRADRRESLEGVVLQALITRWHLIDCRDRVPLGSVCEEVRLDYPYLTPERASKLLRKTLGFVTNKIDGRAYVINPGDRLRALAPRYGLSLDRPGPPPPSPPQ